MREKRFLYARENMREQERKKERDELCRVW